MRASSQRTVLAPSSPLPADGQGNYVSGGDGQISDNKSAVFVHNAVWSPTMVSAVRLGWNRLAWDNIVPDQALRGVGIPGVDSSQPGFSSPYEAIYTDPTVFTRPWTITIPNRRVTDNTPQDDSEQPDVPGGASRQRSHHRSVRAYRRGRQRRPRSSGR